MRPGHLSPDGTVLGVVLKGLGLVNVGDALAQVEIHALLLIQPVDLDQGRVIRLLPQAALVTQHDSFDVQPYWL